MADKLKAGNLLERKMFLLFKILFAVVIVSVIVNFVSEILDDVEQITFKDFFYLIAPVVILAAFFVWRIHG